MIEHYIANNCCTFMGLMASGPPVRKSWKLSLFTFSVGWNASQNTDLVLSGHRLPIVRQAPSMPLNRPTPQHAVATGSMNPAKENGPYGSCSESYDEFCTEKSFESIQMVWNWNQVLAKVGVVEFTIIQGVVDDGLDNIKSVGVEEYRARKLSLKTLQHGLQPSIEVDGIVVNLFDALSTLASGGEHRWRTTDGTHVGNDKFPHSHTICLLQVK